MGKVPTQESILDSAEEIEEHARRLLRAAGVGDRLPTPQEDIINCAELVVRGNIDLEDYKQNFLKKASNALISGLGKILGCLDFREKVILISPDLSESKKPFVTFHEVSHNMLPWQVETYKYFADSNEILTPNVERLYDREANYGSGRLLFQCGRFEKEARDYELSLKTGIKLKEDYGTSFHSTFWNYVATNHSSCMLLVLKCRKSKQLIDGATSLPFKLLYPVASLSFMQEFGGTPLPDMFESSHPFVVFMNNPSLSSSYVHSGEIPLRNINNEEVDCSFESWSNSYNVFVLLWKKQRRILRRRRVIFRE